MKQIIYCDCGWAGSPQQLEISDTVNNETVRVCPHCGSDMLPPAVDVSDEAYRNIIDRQKKEMEDHVFGDDDIES